MAYSRQDVIRGPADVYLDGVNMGWTRDGVRLRVNKSMWFRPSLFGLGHDGVVKQDESFYVSTVLCEHNLTNFRKAWGIAESVTFPIASSDYIRLDFGGSTEVPVHRLKVVSRQGHVQFVFYKVVSVDFGEVKYDKGHVYIPVTFRAILDTSKPVGSQVGYMLDGDNYFAYSDLKISVDIPKIKRKQLPISLSVPKIKRNQLYCSVVKVGTSSSSSSRSSSSSSRSSSSSSRSSSSSSRSSSSSSSSRSSSSSSSRSSSSSSSSSRSSSSSSSSSCRSSSSSSSSCRSSSSSSCSSSSSSRSSSSSSSSSYSTSLTAYYFSESTGSNLTGTGTIGNPWQRFAGKLSGTAAMNAGDSAFFKTGDTWNSSNASVVVNSNGTAANPINLDKYGVGPDPVFRYASLATTWTYSGTPGIYYKSGMYDWPNTVGVDDTYALCAYWGTATTLPAGSFRSALNGNGSLYIRLPDDSDPNTHNIYVPTGSQPSSYRGIVRGSDSRGSYLYVNNLRVLYADGPAFSFSQPNSRFVSCEAVGAGADGFSFVGYTPNNEMADGCRAYSCTATYCNAAGSGHSQAYTTGASQTWWVDCIADNNFMAGFDFLDYSSDTDVQECGALRCIASNNGRWTSNPSYDPGIYIDGARKIYIYGCTAYGAGLGQGVAGNARTGVSWGSEHPGSKPVSEIYIINNKIYKNHWVGMGTGNQAVYASCSAATDVFTQNNHGLSNGNIIYFVSQTPSSVPGGFSMNVEYYVVSATTNTFKLALTAGGTAIDATTDSASVAWNSNNITYSYIINNTIMGYQAGTFDMAFNFSNLNTHVAGNVVIKNNIFVSTSITNNHYATYGSHFDEDYNLHYRTGGSLNVYRLASTSVSYIIDAWRTLTGQAANSFNADPKFLDQNENSFDPRLWNTGAGQAVTSPAVGAAVSMPFTPPSWLPVDLFPNGGYVEGTTRTDGAEDVGVQDLGYHAPTEGTSSSSSSRSSSSCSSSSSSCRSSSSSSSSRSSSSSSSSCRSSSSSSSSKIDSSSSSSCRSSSCSSSSSSRSSSSSSSSCRSSSSSSSSCRSSSSSSSSSSRSSSSSSSSQNSGPVNLVLDDFNRANSSTTLGANWQPFVSSGSLSYGVQSNKAYNPTAGFYGGAAWAPSTFGPNSEAYITFDTVPTNSDWDDPTLTLRWNLGSLNGYQLGIMFQTNGLQRWRIYRTDGGVNTTIAGPTTQAVVAGDKVWFTAIGSTLTGYLYHGGVWTQIIQATDATYNVAGTIGFYIPGENVAARVDDFGGGNYS